MFNLHRRQKESKFMAAHAISRAIFLGLFLIAKAPASLAMAFSLGDIYSSNYFTNTINHYNSAGNYLDSMVLSPTYGSDVRGLAFGSQGWLYAVTATTSMSSNFGVVAIDNTGAVREQYAASAYLGGNISYGKITFGNNGQFFVAGGNNLFAFTPGSPNPTVIYTNNQVFDVKTLPSGNLLVLSAYQLQEITPTGSIVRTIMPNLVGGLGDARGIEYDPATNEIYVTMLGYTGYFSSLLRLNGTTGLVVDLTSYTYGDDLFLTLDKHLLVGSRVLSPGIFDLNLNQTGSLTGDPQLFVTQVQVPEPATMSLLALGIVLLSFSRWRSRLLHL